MVIQRWQSAFLFLAGILLGASIINPIAIVDGDIPQVLLPLDSVVSIIMCLLATILTFIVIFMYKNLRLQIKTTYICVILSIAYVASNYIMVTASHSVLEYEFGGVYVLVAILLQIFAAYRMRSDENKLKSYDRIR